MVVRVVAGICVCFLTLLLFFGRAFAQSAQSSIQPGLIVVTVTDAATGKPIDDAQVFLLGGDQPQSSLTNAKGLLLFDNLQPGIYHVEVKAGGYADSSAAEADVGEGQRVNVAVALAPSIRTIAAVVARPSVSVTTEDINADSPERKVSQSLLDALGKLAGVDVEDQLYGGDSAFNISLHGADASQTGYSIDGVQVRGPAGQAMSGFQDLFGGSSVDFSPSAASSGGMVSFWTAQPTKIPSYHFTGVAGNYGNTLGEWTASGGAGKAAFVVEHTGGGQDDPLDGRFFADSSGSAYVHQGGFARRSDMVKTALTFSPVTSLRYSILSGNSTDAGICSSDVTLLPCSYGQGDITHRHSLMQTVNFSSIAGHLQFNAFYTHLDFGYNGADPNRAVNGQVVPFYSSADYPWWSAGAYTSASAGRHTISAGFYTSRSRGSYSSTYNGKSTLSSSREERFGSIWMGEKVKAGDKLAFNYTLSQASGTGAGTNLELYANGTWQPRSTDAFSFGVGVGSAQPAPTFTGIIGDPLTAQYDCYNGSVFVNGPGDQATRQSSADYNLGWRHTWKRGEFNVDAYRNQMNGQGLFAQVPLGAELGSIFPNGAAQYLASLAQVWSQPTVCGSTPFDPSRVYVSQYLSGIGQVNQGFTASGRVILSKNAMLLPDYAVTSSALDTLDPRLLFPGSYYSAGRQLPHHPLRTAGLTLVGAFPRERMEWDLNAQFTDANNWENLPAYTIYNAGVIFSLQRGSLRILESNIFGTHTGLFTTYQGVNPMPMQGGGMFSIATTPLPPRSFSVEYDVHWQQRMPRPAPKRGATATKKTKPEV